MPSRLSVIANLMKEKRQRTDRTPKPCGMNTDLGSAPASWSARSPLPLPLNQAGATDSLHFRTRSLSDFGLRDSDPRLPDQDPGVAALTAALARFAEPGLPALPGLGAPLPFCPWVG